MCIVATKNGAVTTKGRVYARFFSFFAPSDVCFLLGDRISTLLRDVRQRKRAKKRVFSETLVKFVYEASRTKHRTIVTALVKRFVLE